MLDDQIERCFGTGPEHRPVEQRIAAGRRALWRRRVTAALTAAGMVAVLGATYAVAVPGPDRDGAGEVATDPTPTPPTATASAEPTRRPWRNLTARYADDGRLEIRPGVVVHEHIPNPYDWKPPQHSDALDITWRGRRLWTIVRLNHDGLGYTTTQPSSGWSSFADWVADGVRFNRAAGDSVPRTLVLAGDRVVAARGVTILQRTDDPRLGPRFASPGTPTGAAVVTLDTPGFSYFVVWRVVAGTLDTIVTPPAEVNGATFDELLTYARAKYAAGSSTR